MSSRAKAAPQVRAVLLAIVSMAALLACSGDGDSDDPPAGTSVLAEAPDATEVRDRVNDITRRTSSSVNQVLSLALDRLEEARFWQEYAAAAAQVASDPAAVTVDAAERAVWERTLRDGVDA